MVKCTHKIHEKNHWINFYLWKHDELLISSDFRQLNKLKFTFNCDELENTNYHKCQNVLLSGLKNRVQHFYIIQPLMKLGY